MVIAIIIYSAVIVALLIAFMLMYLKAKSKEMETAAELQRINQENAVELQRINQMVEDVKRTTEVAEDRFKVLASESLHQNASQLRQSTSDELQKILSPIKLRLEDFNSMMQKTYTDASASRQSLSDQIERLTRLNLTIGEDARNLATALKGNNRVQGKWGETVLESLLENAGLLRDVNFETQVTQSSSGKALRNDEGQMIRPDMIIHLPHERDVIVDAKASLSAYLEFCEAKDETSRQNALKRHVLSIKKHIEELAQRNYAKAIDTAMEQVLMFIPNDGALIIAIDAEPQLLEAAMSKKISLVSPSQMMNVLMMVNQMWRKDNQDRNAFEIAKLGGLLYDSIESFTKEMQNIETSLAKASKSYEAAYSKLVGGQRSVIARAERLKILGAKTAKSISLEVIATPEIQPSGDGQINEAV